MSGVLRVSSIDGYVYSEAEANLKKKGSGPNDPGAQRNVELVKEAEESAKRQTQKVKSLIEHFVQNRNEFQFLPIEKGFVFKPRTFGSTVQFPIFLSDEDLLSAKGKSGYCRLKEDPLIVVRFKEIPSLELMRELKILVAKVGLEN